MAYASVEDLRTYLRIADAEDDALLEHLLEAARGVIDAHCRRTFAATEGQREYDGDALDLVDPMLLYLDDDAAEVVSVTNSGTPVTDYCGVPRKPPYFALRRKSGWILPVIVEAYWGYSKEPPADIVQANVRLAAYFYRQRDAQVFDVTAIPDQGVITVPRGLPADVERILAPYRRLT